MKPKINKTITTKGGGNIIVPNKIISKEYPENTPVPVEEPMLYAIKLTKVPGVSLVNIKAYIHTDNYTYQSKIYTYTKLYYISGYLFKDALSQTGRGNNVICVVYLGDVIRGRCSLGVNYNNVIKTSNSGSSSDAVATSGQTYFFSKNKKDLIDVINNFCDDVEYETNFDLD